MKVNIHRGTKEIGGNCIEIESQDKRIVLDIGLPIDAKSDEEIVPEIDGIQDRESSLLGVIISHPHLDHYGLAGHIHSSIPVFVGEAAQRILEVSSIFTPNRIELRNVKYLEDLKSFKIGPFKITPYLNDHSAYDSYSLLIEADDKKLFYSSDFRGHGRKSKLFDKLLRNPPKKVEVLIMEGTTITEEISLKTWKTENELEKCFTKHIQSTKGIVLVMTSGQNIDRLVTIYKAAKRCKRQFILDMYTAEVLKATNNPRLPQANWEGIKIYLPNSQRRQIKQNEMFEISDYYRPYRIYPEKLSDEAGHSVMLFRPSMISDLNKASCIKNSCLIYSLWKGYLEQERMEILHSWLNKNDIPLIHCHTSGHASINDLKKFTNAISAKTVIPIHTLSPRKFNEYFQNVEEKEDGIWWEV
jgi:ribonuclease J